MQQTTMEQGLISCLPDVDILEVIEFESGAYPSMRFTQNALRCLKTSKELSTADELRYMFLKPHIIMIRDSQQVNSDVAKMLVNPGHKGKNVPIMRHTMMRVFTDRPRVMVVVLNPSETHDSKCLSKTDKILLQDAKSLIKKNQDTLFILHDKAELYNRYTEQCLANISLEIQMQLEYEIAPGSLLGNLFVFNEKLIPTRIGFLLQMNILKQIALIEMKTKTIRNDFETELNRLKNNEKKQTVIMAQRIIDTKPCYGQPSLSCNELKGICKTVLMKMVKIKIIRGHLKTDPKILNSLISVNIRPLLCCLSHYKDKSPLTREKLKNKNGSKKTPDLSSKIFEKRCTQEIVRKMYLGLLQKVKDCVKEKKDYFVKLDDIMSKELATRSDNVTLHRWRTVVDRNDRTQGFEFTNGIVSVFLKKDSTRDKKIVKHFLEEHLDTSEFVVNIEYRRREVIWFSSLEQGSRIKKDKEATEKLQKWGSLGMFLRDDNETYFFTTCAHVIGEKSMAYSSEDNTVLGESVFVCQPHTDGTDTSGKQTGIDFSLIRLRPEKELTCNLGLKTPKSDFIIGQVYNGDVEEILGCDVYKWGAAAPFMQRGKCIGFGYDRPFVYIRIDTEHFAQKGDSGSLICVQEDEETISAAFVVVGGSNCKTYLVYKISDALALISKINLDLKPCLVSPSRSVKITTSSTIKSTSISTSKVLQPRK